MHSAWEFQTLRELQVRVPRAQHGRKPGGLLFAAPAFARLLEMPMVSDALQGSLAVNLLFQAPQGPFYWLAFSKFDLSQSISLPLHISRKQASATLVCSLKSAQDSFCAPSVSTGKNRTVTRCPGTKDPSLLLFQAFSRIVW
jgi:hypothetical protein